MQKSRKERLLLALSILEKNDGSPDLVESIRRALEELQASE